MEFEDVSLETEREEVKRVAAAFEVTTLELVGDHGFNAYVYVGQSSLAPETAIVAESITKRERF
ncbi:hypothetical protein EON83_12685 [bacterium]|nr:MAG: hypothetical protein EON83_12685 [bacterium]